MYTDSVKLDNVNERPPVRSDEFFDVARHATMHFVGAGVAQEGGPPTVRRDLTIRGITRRVTVQNAGHAAGQCARHCSVQ